MSGDVEAAGVVPAAVRVHVDLHLRIRGRLRRDISRDVGVNDVDVDPSATSRLVVVREERVPLSLRAHLPFWREEDRLTLREPRVQYGGEFSAAVGIFGRCCGFGRDLADGGAEEGVRRW